MVGQSLTLEQKLQQRLSPQQILMVKLLELPSCDLEARINEELQNNFALEDGKLNDNDNDNDNDNFDDYTNQDNYPEEEEYHNPLQNEDFNYDQYTQDDELPDYRYYNTGSGTEDDGKEMPVSYGTSFGEYLKSQIYLTHMTKPERHIAKFVVGNIDENGYLHRSAEELCDDLYFQEGLTVTDEQMHLIIDQIQHFDPAGVGAHNLQECLQIQLRARGKEDLATQIIHTCFKEFSHRNFDRITEKLGCSQEELKQAIQEITKLNPKPGSAWQGTIMDRRQTTITPDFCVENQDGKLILTLNKGDVPQLHVSRQYRDILKTCTEAAHPSKKQKEEAQFIKQRLDAAQAFIDALQQREDTLRLTMEAIIKMQYDWFMEGDETYLHPLILQDIANLTGLDVSTISRVSNSKYVQTEYGVFPLKYFFSEKMTNAEGETISTREIKKILQECIANENKSAPLTDDELVKLLKEKGYPIARRTVAKYRDQLHIPVARLRLKF